MFFNYHHTASRTSMNQHPFYVLMCIMSIFIATTVTCATVPVSAISHYKKFTEIEKNLATEKISSIVPMRDFLLQQGQVAHFQHDVCLIEFEMGMKAVFKQGDMRNAVAEVAAYRASQFFELYRVPPTILYELDGKVGSLQYYIEPAFDLMVKKNYNYVKQQLSPDAWARIQLFYFIMGQWDPDPSNFIAQKNGDAFELYLIDNAACGDTQKVRYGDYPFVALWKIEHEKPAKEGESFPFDATFVLPPDPAVLQTTFQGRLQQYQIKRLCRLQEPIYCITWNGYVWRQFRFGDPCVTDVYPSDLMQLIATVTYDQVVSFFANEHGVIFEPEFLQDILERRDQVIAAYRKQL
jgi:hypothetical protein